MTDVIPTSQDNWQDQQEDLRQAQEKIVGPVPLIEEPSLSYIDLQRGVFARENWQKRVTLRELTGADEEALSKLKDPGEFFDQVLAYGTERVGDLDMSDMPISERQSWLQRLLIGERDQLFLGVVRATYGDTKTLIMTCRICQQRQDLNINLSEDFKPSEVANVTDDKFRFVTSKGNRLDIRPAIGEDQMELLSRKGVSAAEQNTIMLSRCILSCNDEILLDPMDFARHLSMRDRQAIMNELLERQPRVDLEVTVNCVSCGGEQTVDLGWGDLFRL